MGTHGGCQWISLGERRCYVTATVRAFRTPRRYSLYFGSACQACVQTSRQLLLVVSCICFCQFICFLGEGRLRNAPIGEVCPFNSCPGRSAPLLSGTGEARSALEEAKDSSK